MKPHSCRQTGQNNELIYICSRCRQCYVCRHKFVFFAEAEKWMVRCADGKFREIIMDGNLRA